MSDPITLLALAERCEQAAGPDRVLDAEILCAIYGFTIHKENRCVNSSSWDRVTGSLDAAVTLVPEGWDFCISKGWDEECAVSLAPANKVTEVISTSTTPALALCAAALQARAAAYE
jgi:hypothetical protein